MADKVLDGHFLSADEGLAILRADESELLDILAAAYRVRRRFFGNQVQLNYLINAKSGHCSEDCGYCSQSRVSKAPIEKYALLDPEAIFDGARISAENKVRTYCIVTAGRSPGENELQIVEEVVPRIKKEFRLAVCFSTGLLSLDQAKRLKAAGVDRVNHNLNTSARFYPRICTTHVYQERLDTLQRVREAGLEICSGGIIGMGEEDEDVVELALQLSRLQVEALPVNFLQPIAGTPLEGIWRLNPRYCLKALALFRFTNPKAELRIAGGREMHLRSLQPLGLYAANSIFLDGYLTTRGAAIQSDFKMLEDLGFQPVFG